MVSSIFSTFTAGLWWTVFALLRSSGAELVRVQQLSKAQVSKYLCVFASSSISYLPSHTLRQCLGGVGAPCWGGLCTMSATSTIAQEPLYYRKPVQVWHPVTQTPWKGVESSAEPLWVTTPGLSLRKGCYGDHGQTWNNYGSLETDFREYHCKLLYSSSATTCVKFMLPFIACLVLSIFNLLKYNKYSEMQEFWVAPKL